jgi:hypothetical protein
MQKFLTSNVKLNDQGIKDNSKKKEVSSSSQVNSNQSRGGHDLLSLLQAAGRDDEKKQDEEVWNSDSQRNSTYSINDISMNNKIAGKKKKTGWNLVDGKKTYTTYRNGGIVQGQGAEAFKLSMGDSKPTKTKGKESETEENRKSTSKAVSTKENKLPKRTNSNANSSNNECNSRNREDSSKKAKLCNFENLPGNSQFDFSFA